MQSSNDDSPQAQNNADSSPRSAAGESGTSLQAVVKLMNSALSANWERLFADTREELEDMFVRYGDRAYGAYVQRLMAPVAEAAAEAGYAVKAGFSLADSIENWGPPEERERCVWYPVKRQDGELAGTAVLQFFHSHARYRLPAAPRFFPLESTDREDIAAAVSSPAARAGGGVSRYRDAASGEPVRQWEYATDTGLGDYLPTDPGQAVGGYIDHALTQWGRNGWELVSVIQREHRAVGFFKRPVS